MSPSVFLARCDPANFDRTVRTEIDPSEYDDRPDELAGTDAVRLWGAPEGSRNEDAFDRMEPGDLVLFNQDGTYVGTGRVGATFDDGGWASETFWDDAPMELVYTVEDFSEIDVPASAVNHLFGYDADYSASALMRVADSRVGKPARVIERILERYTEKQG